MIALAQADIDLRIKPPLLAPTRAPEESDAVGSLIKCLMRFAGAWSKSKTSFAVQHVPTEVQF